MGISRACTADTSAPVFGSRAPKTTAPHPRVDERADAHQARLERHVEVDTGHPVVAERPRGLAQRHHLGVGRRVDRANRPVVSTANDRSTRDGHGADWHLAGVRHQARLLERQTHEALVIGDGRHRFGVKSWLLKGGAVGRFTTLNPKLDAAVARVATGRQRIECPREPRLVFRLDRGAQLLQRAARLARHEPLERLRYLLVRRVIFHRVVQTFLQLVELVRGQRPVAVLAREPQLVVTDLVRPMISPRPGAKDAGGRRGGRLLLELGDARLECGEAGRYRVRSTPR